MPMIRECSKPDCHTLTMGGFCLAHEEPEGERILAETAVAPVHRLPPKPASPLVHAPPAARTASGASIPPRFLEKS